MIFSPVFEKDFISIRLEWYYIKLQEEFGGRLYLLVREFTLYNNHRAIANLLNNPNRK